MQTRRSLYARIGVALVGRSVLVLLCLGWAPSARGQDPSIEQRLLSADPTVSGPAVELARGSGSCQTASACTGSGPLVRVGSRDDAVFWNFAGMIREAYAPPDERAQENGQLMGWLGTPINAYFLPDDGARAQKLEAHLGQILKTWLVK